MIANNLKSLAGDVYLIDAAHCSIAALESGEENEPPFLQAIDKATRVVARAAGTFSDDYGCLFLGVAVKVAKRHIYQLYGSYHGGIPLIRDHRLAVPQGDLLSVREIGPVSKIRAPDGG